MNDSQQTGAGDPATTPRAPDRARRVQGVVAVAVLALGVAGYGFLSRKPARQSPPPAVPPPIRTRAVELVSRDFPVVVRSLGVVRAREEVPLSAQVAGRVARVAPEFEDGAFFGAGSVLVELDDGDHRNALAMAEARVQAAGAAARLAELNQQRDAELLRNNLLPTAQAETTAALLAQARADAATAAAQLDRARRDLERTRVRAPFDGCVRRRTVGPGQWVTPGTPLGEVFAVDAIEVRLPVSGAALDFLRLPGERIRQVEVPPSPGRATAFRVEVPEEPLLPVALQDSLDPDPAFHWRGHVVRGEQVLDGNTLERFVIVRVDDPFGVESGLPPLRPGQPVTGFLPGSTLTNVLVVPRIAVRELDRIHLVDPATLTLSSRRITPIWSDEEHVIARDPGIPSGALVATTHLVYAPEGARVEIIPAADADTLRPTGTNGPAAPRGAP